MFSQPKEVNLKVLKGCKEVDLKVLLFFKQNEGSSPF